MLAALQLKNNDRAPFMASAAPRRCTFYAPHFCAFCLVQVVVCDVAAQEQLWSSQHGHTETIFDCSFAPGPSSSLLATCSFDSTVRVWDAATNTCVKTMDTKAIAREEVVHVKGLEVSKRHSSSLPCLHRLVHHAGQVVVISSTCHGPSNQLTACVHVRCLCAQVFQAMHCTLWPGALTAASWQHPVQEGLCTSLTMPRVWL